MVKNTVVGVERAISQIFSRGDGGRLETEKAFLCLGVVYFFFQGLVPFHSAIPMGGVGFVGRGWGGMVVVVCFQVGVLFIQVWDLRGFTKNII